MNVRNPYLEDRLAEWVAFYRDIKDHGLGYPTECPYLRNAIRSNVEGILSSTSSENINAEQIENLVMRMGQLYPEWEIALRRKYFCDRHKQISQIAKELHISVYTLDSRLACAKSWLDGALAIDSKDFRNQPKLYAVN